MRILYIYGRINDEAGRNMVQALKETGNDVLVYSEEPMVVTVLDDDHVRGVTEFIQKHEIDLLVSIHFIMSAELAAYKTGIRYISILWDAPYTEIYNPLGKMNNVWISTFDKLDKDRMLANGVKHVMYQPLSVYTKKMTEWNREVQNTLQGNYIHDISFIGSLYGKNLYDDHLAQIPVNIQPYFNSIFEEAAFQWDGVNRVYGKTGTEILRYIQMMNPEFQIPNNQEIEDVRAFEIYYLIRKIANIERIAVLNLLAESHSVKLYTDDRSAGEKLVNVEMGPPVIYGKATAMVYAGSKINLNISLKGIEGGTPLRVMDIMGAGGFVLSSYCAETAELFEEDKEIVMFRTPEELMEKTDYYLTHDAEREQIARAGYDKVMNCYTHQKKLKELLHWAGE